MKLVASSVDTSLDRAAWGAITASNPFKALPSEFSGPYLRLRFRFFYNHDKADLSNVASYVPEPANAHAVLIPDIADSNPPKYPKKARMEKVDGIVRLDAEVGTDGKVKDLKVIEGNPALAEAAINAIRNWRFHPARKDGREIEDHVRIRVDFRLDREQVRAHVVSPESTPSERPAQ
jgi:TonB family protein